MFTYPYGPAGFYLMSRLPSIVKLASDVAQARVAAGSAIAGSLVDYVNSAYAAYPFPGVMYPPPPPGRGPGFAARPGFAVNVTQGSSWHPTTVNFVEGDNGYTAYVELPDAHLRDISVKVDGRQVSVYRHHDGAEQSAIIALPDDVDLDTIAADYQDGVLQVRVQKDSKLVRREVKVGSGRPTPTTKTS